MHWILAHFIGDFILQNDWMAINKKTNSIACTIHCMFYIFPFAFTGLEFYQIVLIFIQHWFQDRFQFIKWWCKMTGSFQNELKQDVLPWGHFIVDQIFHFIWMYLVIQNF